MVLSYQNSRVPGLFFRWFWRSRDGEVQLQFRGKYETHGSCLLFLFHVCVVVLLFVCLSLLAIILLIPLLVVEEVELEV